MANMPEPKVIQKDFLRMIKKSKFGKSMIKNVLIRPLSILINLFYTPLLLHYLGDEKYGLWATVMSVLSWVNFCDIGIGNGMRNMVTQELLQNKNREVRKTVSTAYVTMGVVSFALMLMLGLISLLIDWKKLFNTTINVRGIMLISFFFLALNFVLGLGKSILYALQESEKVAMIGLCSSLLQLSGLLFLRRWSAGNLWLVAVLFGLSTSVVCFGNDMLLAYKKECFSPRLRFFDRSRVRTLVDTGILFLILQMGGIVMSSTDNVLISRYYGPEAVTPYSSVVRFFSAINSLYIAMIVPVWSRTTKAVTNGDYSWIRNLVKRLHQVLLVMAVGELALVLIYPQISRIWLRKELNYPPFLILTASVCSILELVTMTCANILNGMNLLKFQAVTAVFQSIANIPLSIFLAKNCGWGTVGIKAATLFLFAFSSIAYDFYLLKKINR